MPAHPRRSAQYGKFLTSEEVTAITAAPVEDRTEVMRVLTAAGANCVERTGNNVHCSAPVGALNTLLHTSMQAYKHKETGAVVHLVDSDISFPEALAGAWWARNGSARTARAPPRCARPRVLPSAPMRSPWDV